MSSAAQHLAHIRRAVMSTSRWVMIGAGGHARVLQEILGLTGVTLDGFISTEAEPGLPGVSRIGDDSVLAGLDPLDVILVNGVGSAGNPAARIRVWNSAKESGFRFATVVDPTAIVRSSASLAEGAQVLMGAMVGTGVEVGENCIVNTGAIVDHGVRLRSHVHVSPGAALAGEVVVGSSTHIGIGARIIQRTTIGSRSVIGAGAVVLHDVGDDEVAVGVPAIGRPRANHAT